MARFCMFCALLTVHNNVITASETHCCEPVQIPIGVYFRLGPKFFTLRSRCFSVTVMESNPTRIDVVDFPHIL